MATSPRFSGAGQAPLATLEFSRISREPGQVLRDVQLQLFGLWNPERKAHIEALGRVYDILKPLGRLAEEKGIGPRLASVLSKIEDFMIDLGGVHLLERLNDERGWDGLNKIAMHHEGEDRVPAVRALARLGQLKKLETIAECQSDPLVASAAVLEVGKRPVINRHDPPFNEPYSEVVYNLGRLATEAKSPEAKNVAMFELEKLARREDEVGRAAENELRRISVKGVNLMAAKAAIKRTASEVEAGVEGVPDVPDEAFKSNAWADWRKHGNLQKLNDQIEIVAGML